MLREHHFDPVQEYNKILEQFVEQHNPKNQEIFIILVQFCRFFKEFSELETGEKFEFRHPPLKRLHELKDLNLYDELKAIGGIINSAQVNPLKKDETFTVENKKSRNVLKESIIGSDDSKDTENKKEKIYNLIHSNTKTTAKGKELYHYKR